jgi:hypothetical protein
MTLIYRNPESLERLRKRVMRNYPRALASIRDSYATLRDSDDPETFEEFAAGKHDAAVERVALGVLQGIMDSTQVGNVLNRMIWGIISTTGARFPLLTSDRPLVTTMKLGSNESHIVMPISPNRAFVAAGSEETKARIIEADRCGRFATELNDRIARQARRYVYSTTDSQLRFVENRLGKMERAFLWE